jgi:hypothetical protein
MGCLEEAGPNDINLKEVIENNDTRKFEINQLKDMGKYSLKKYLVNVIKLNTLAKNYVKKIEQEIKRDVVTKLCDGELQLEKMKLGRLEEVHKDFKLCTTYMEKKASEGPVS